MGGPNPFESKPVDQIYRPPIELPPNVAVITGYESSGYGYPCSATIRVNPVTLTPMLPPVEELNKNELACLYCYDAIKAGKYRSQYLAGLKQEVIDGMVARGYLERNKAGATKITTKGKNARRGMK